MKKSRFLPLLAAVAALPAFPAYAQDASSDAENPFDFQMAGQEIETVIVVSGVEEHKADVGRAVTVIDRDEIEQRQSIALSDLLATVPGVSVTRNGGVGSFTGVRVRGAEAEQTLVLIDGVRVNDPSSPSGTFDFGNLLTGAIDRVEVLRGPNAVVWGSQAIGGVVNVVTERPRDGFAVRGNAEYGSMDSLSANAALIGGGDRVSGAFTAGYTRTDGISAAASGSEPDGYRQYGASGSLKVQPVDAISIDLRGYFADSRTDLDGFPPPTYGFADTAEYSTARELYGYAGLTAALFDGRFRNRVAFTAADVDRDNFDPAFGTAPSFFGRGSSERYEYQGDFRAAKGVRVVAGAEHEDSRFTDGSTPADTGVTSVYGQLLFEPVHALNLSAGIRHDDHRDYGGHTTAAFSAAYRPAAGTTVRASYGEGFKAPTLYQLHSVYGDPDLQPETAKSYEAGIEQSLLDRRLVLAASFFHRDTVNQIDFDLGTFTYGNIAGARAEGVELGATYTSPIGLVLRANYTHLKAENRSAGANYGNDLARRPRDMGSVSADYRFGADGPSVGATLLVAGDSFDNAANTVRLDGYATVAIRAEVPLTRQLTLYGRIENLFDETYQTVSGYGTPGRAAFGGIRVRLN